MNYCPFCGTDIRNDPAACGHCGRDFALLRPVLGLLAEMESGLRTRIEAHLASGKPFADLESAAVGLNHDLTEPVPEHPVSTPAPAAPAKPAYVLHLLLALLVGLLLLAHWLIVIVFDLNVLVLRIASILIPLPFSILHMRWGKKSLKAEIAIAVVSAAAAVFGMSAVTGWHDEVPVFPQDLLEWQEALEYTASMALAYLTGVLISRASARRVSPKVRIRGALFTFAKWVARRFGYTKVDDAVLERQLQALARKSSGVLPILSAVASIAAGVKTLLK